MHDLVIRNANLVDGTGAPARLADVAVEGAFISEVAAAGKAGAGKRELDAAGRLLTPGFVDIHTHYDAQASWDPYLTPSSQHGCTTVVMGNCGVGFAPADPARHAWLIRLMEGVEDIPGTALTEGITWGWETFPEYLDVISRRDHAIDYAALVAHSAVRGYVMGDRGAKNEDATPDDIARMAAIVGEGIAAGAFGFSTSRTPIHKSMDGEFAPGTFAKHDELFGIARAMAKAGGGMYQTVIWHPNLLDELKWIKELARETGLPVSFNLQQFDQAPQMWREVLSELDAIEAERLPIYAQVAGRGIGILMSWEGTAHPFAIHPTFLKMAGLTPAQRLAELKKPEVRAQILGEQQAPLSMLPAWITPEFASFVLQSFHKMYLVQGAIDYEPTAEHTLTAMSAATGKSVYELAYDHMCNGGLIYFPVFNYADSVLEPTRALHQHPRTRLGLSDAGAHCGSICDGGMPTFMLTHWARDRTRGEKMPLEFVVKRQTSETAAMFGFHDRGVVAPGKRADLNLINYDELKVMTPFMAYDLPAGGRRLMQNAKGYDATFVAGVQIVDHDQFTGALPGKLVRHGR